MVSTMQIALRADATAPRALLSTYMPTNTRTHRAAAAPAKPRTRRRNIRPSRRLTATMLPPAT
jgi:hypothetical protein